MTFLIQVYIVQQLFNMCEFFAFFNKEYKLIHATNAYHIISTLENLFEVTD